MGDVADSLSPLDLAATVDALTQAMLVWDEDNYTHCRRTSVYAAAIARNLGLGADAIEYARIGALLHDIGKIGVDLAVLKKPDRLDDDERARVHLHPAMGESILARVLPQPIVECAAGHHEQPDGLGYPAGLREEQIPLGALICRVADVLDSLTTAQTYRPAMSIDEAIAELRDGAGTRYSERIVASALTLIEAQGLPLAA